MATQESEVAAAKRSEVRAVQTPPVQAVNAGVNTIRYNTKNWDALNEFDNVATYRFSPLRAGTYLIHANVAIQMLAGDNWRYDLGLSLNGVTAYGNDYHLSDGTANTMVLHNTDLVPMVPGDWVEVRVTNAGAAARNVATGNGLTYFFARRIS